MIKYVRTKDDKIVKIDTENDVFTSKYEIVGEPTDNPEELCDIFVIWTKGLGLKNPIQYNNPTQTNIYINLKINKDHIGDVYGAIWTDKGLIYKAKMNEEGKFELI